MGGRGSASGGGRGSAGAGRVDRPSRTAVGVAAQEERRTVSLRHEEALGVMDSGEVVLTKRGTRNQVSFTAEEVARLENGTLTHNHPRGSSFSPEDIKFASGNNLKQIRAVGRNELGETHLYTATRRVGGWNTSVPRTNESIGKAVARVRADMGKRISTGKLSPQRADADFWHSVMKIVSKDLSFEYKRKKIR